MSRRVDVLGVQISDTNPSAAIATIDDLLRAQRCAYVCVTPVSGVMAAQRQVDVMRALNGADMTVPDGMPMVWAGRYAGSRSIKRVYGPDLMDSVCEMAAERGWTSFVYGGAEGVAEELGSRLQDRHPGLEIVDSHSPPFRALTDAEKNKDAERIDSSGADLVWVGLSTPKQDLWMADMVGRLQRPVVMLGVGAAFDVLSGAKKRPPGWLGPLGLFWLYRLLQEPRRLWRRYLYDVPQFLVRIVRQPPTFSDRNGS